MPVNAAKKEGEVCTASAGQRSAKTEGVTSSSESLRGTGSVKGGVTGLVNSAVYTPKQSSLSAVNGFPPSVTNSASSPFPSILRTSSTVPTRSQESESPICSSLFDHRQHGKHINSPPAVGRVGAMHADSGADTVSNAYCRLCEVDVVRGAWMAHQRSEAHQQRLHECGTVRQGRPSRPPVVVVMQHAAHINDSTKKEQSTVHVNKSTTLAEPSHSPPDEPDTEKLESNAWQSKRAAVTPYASDEAGVFNEARGQRRRFQMSPYSESTPTETEASVYSDDFECVDDNTSGTPAEKGISALHTSEQQQQLQQRQESSAIHTSTTSYSIPPISTPLPSVDNAYSNVLFTLPIVTSVATESIPTTETSAWRVIPQVHYVELSSAQQERRRVRELEKRLHAYLYEKEVKLLRTCLRRWYTDMFIKATTEPEATHSLKTSQAERVLSSLSTSTVRPSALTPAADAATDAVAHQDPSQRDNEDITEGKQQPKRSALAASTATSLQEIATSRSQRAPRYREQVPSSSNSGPAPIITAQIKTYAHVHLTADGRLNPVGGRRDSNADTGNSISATSESEGQELEVMHTDVQWVLRPSVHTALPSSSTCSSTDSSLSSPNDAWYAALQRAKEQLKDVYLKASFDRAKEARESVEKRIIRADAGAQSEGKEEEKEAVPPQLAQPTTSLSGKRPSNPWATADKSHDQVNGQADLNQSYEDTSDAFREKPVPLQQCSSPGQFAPSPQQHATSLLLCLHAHSSAANANLADPASYAPLAPLDDSQEVPYADDFTSDTSSTLSEEKKVVYDNATIDSASEDTRGPLVTLRHILKPDSPDAEPLVVNSEKEEEVKEIRNMEVRKGNCGPVDVDENCSTVPEKAPPLTGIGGSESEQHYRPLKDTSKTTTAAAAVQSLSHSSLLSSRPSSSLHRQVSKISSNQSLPKERKLPTQSTSLWELAAVAHTAVTNVSVFHTTADPVVSSGVGVETNCDRHSDSSDGSTSDAFAEVKKKVKMDDEKNDVVLRGSEGSILLSARGLETDVVEAVPPAAEGSTDAESETAAEQLIDQSCHPPCSEASEEVTEVQEIALIKAGVAPLDDHEGDVTIPEEVEEKQASDQSPSNDSRTGEDVKEALSSNKEEQKAEDESPGQSNHEGAKRSLESTSSSSFHPVELNTDAASSHASSKALSTSSSSAAASSFSSSSPSSLPPSSASDIEPLVSCFSQNAKQRVQQSFSGSLLSALPIPEPALLPMGITTEVGTTVALNTSNLSATAPDAATSPLLGSKHTLSRSPPPPQSQFEEHRTLSSRSPTSCSLLSYSQGALSHQSYPSSLPVRTSSGQEVLPNPLEVLRNPPPAMTFLEFFQQHCQQYKGQQMYDPGRMGIVEAAPLGPSIEELLSTVVSSSQRIRTSAKRRASAVVLCDIEPSSKTMPPIEAKRHLDPQKDHQRQHHNHRRLRAAVKKSKLSKTQLAVQVMRARSTSAGIGQLATTGPPSDFQQPIPDYRAIESHSVFFPVVMDSEVSHGPCTDTAGDVALGDEEYEDVEEDDSVPQHSHEISETNAQPYERQRGSRTEGELLYRRVHHDQESTSDFVSLRKHDAAPSDDRANHHDYFSILPQNELCDSFNLSELAKHLAQLAESSEYKDKEHEQQKQHSKADLTKDGEAEEQRAREEEVVSNNAICSSGVADEDARVEQGEEEIIEQPASNDNAICQSDTSTEEKNILSAPSAAPFTPAPPILFAIAVPQRRNDVSGDSRVTAKSTAVGEGDKKSVDYELSSSRVSGVQRHFDSGHVSTANAAIQPLSKAHGDEKKRNSEKPSSTFFSTAAPSNAARLNVPGKTQSVYHSSTKYAMTAAWHHSSSNGGCAHVSQHERSTADLPTGANGAFLNPTDGLALSTGKAERDTNTTAELLTPATVSLVSDVVAQPMNAQPIRPVNSSSSNSFAPGSSTSTTVWPPRKASVRSPSNVPGTSLPAMALSSVAAEAVVTTSHLQEKVKLPESIGVANVEGDKRKLLNAAAVSLKVVGKSKGYSPKDEKLHFGDHMSSQHESGNTQHLPDLSARLPDTEKQQDKGDNILERQARYNLPTWPTPSSSTELTQVEANTSRVPGSKASGQQNSTAGQDRRNGSDFIFTSNANDSIAGFDVRGGTKNGAQLLPAERLPVFSSRTEGQRGAPEAESADQRRHFRETTEELGVPSVYVPLLFPQSDRALTENLPRPAKSKLQHNTGTDAQLVLPHISTNKNSRDVIEEAFSRCTSEERNRLFSERPDSDEKQQPQPQNEKLDVGLGRAAAGFTTGMRTLAMTALACDGASVAPVPDSSNMPWGSAAAASWQRRPLPQRTPALPLALLPSSEGGPVCNSDDDAVAAVSASLLRHLDYDRHPSRTPRLSDAEAAFITASSSLREEQYLSRSKECPSHDDDAVFMHTQPTSSLPNEERKEGTCELTRAPQIARGSVFDPDTKAAVTIGLLFPKTVPSLTSRTGGSPLEIMPTAHPYFHRVLQSNATGLEKGLLTDGKPTSVRSSPSSSSFPSAAVAKAAMKEVANRKQLRSATFAASLPSFSTSASSSSSLSSTPPRSLSAAASVAARRKAQQQAYTRSRLHNMRAQCQSSKEELVVPYSADLLVQRCHSCHHSRHTAYHRRRNSCDPHEEEKKPQKEAQSASSHPVVELTAPKGNGEFQERNQERSSVRKSERGNTFAVSNDIKKVQQTDGNKGLCRESRRHRDTCPRCYRLSRDSRWFPSTSGHHSSRQLSTHRHRRRHHRLHHKVEQRSPSSRNADGREEETNRGSGAPVSASSRKREVSRERRSDYGHGSEQKKKGDKVSPVDARRVNPHNSQCVPQENLLFPSAASLHKQSNYVQLHPYEIHSLNRPLLSAPPKGQMMRATKQPTTSVLLRDCAVQDVGTQLVPLVSEGSSTVPYGSGTARLHSRVHHRHRRHSTPLPKLFFSPPSSSSAALSHNSRSRDTSVISTASVSEVGVNTMDTAREETTERSGGSSQRSHVKEDRFRHSVPSLRVKSDDAGTETDNDLQGGSRGFSVSLDAKKGNLLLQLGRAHKHRLSTPFANWQHNDHHSTTIKLLPDNSEIASPHGVVVNPLVHGQQTLEYKKEGRRSSSGIGNAEKANHAEDEEGTRSALVSLQGPSRATLSEAKEDEEEAENRRNLDDDDTQLHRKERRHIGTYRHRQQHADPLGVFSSKDRNIELPIQAGSKTADAESKVALITTKAQKSEMALTEHEALPFAAADSKHPYQTIADMLLASPHSELADPKCDGECEPGSRRYSHHMRDGRWPASQENDTPVNSDVDVATPCRPHNANPEYHHPSQDVLPDFPTAAQPGDLFYKDETGAFHRIRDDKELRQILTTAVSNMDNSQPPLYVVHNPQGASLSSPCTRRSRSPTTAASRVLPRRVWTITDPKSPLGCSRLNPYCTICRMKYNLIFVDVNMRPLRWPSPHSAELAQMGDCRVHSGYVFGGGGKIEDDFTRAASLTEQRERALYTQAWPPRPRVSPAQLLVQEEDAADRPLRQLTPPPRGQFIPVSYEMHEANVPPRLPASFIEGYAKGLPPSATAPIDRAAALDVIAASGRVKHAFRSESQMRASSSDRERDPLIQRQLPPRHHARKHGHHTTHYRDGDELRRIYAPSSPLTSQNAERRSPQQRSHSAFPLDAGSTNGVRYGEAPTSVMPFKEHRYDSRKERGAAGKDAAQGVCAPAAAVAATSLDDAAVLRCEERKMKKKLKQLLWNDVPQQRGSPEWNRYVRLLRKELR